MKKPALFLDRDGVINIEKRYLYKIEDFVFIDGVFETCRYFQNQGYHIIVITNQAGIARGIYNENDFHNITNWMIEEFKQEEIALAKVYHCPHHPDFTNGCDCRKPKPGLILQARHDFDLNLSKSILVGDKNTDIESGIKAGVGNNFLITTGHKIEENKHGVEIINNLTELIDKKLA
ncbi:D-glycero-beta-D-manno-heptose 1,7-bisphosphate 7-phosphatase [Dehalobacter sp. CF]|jgi:histidinol-phosphate phosphatase family domain/HAD-superfamily hydrolase, subfamily IIIA|uniref:D-glycero-beta-D-manno-heptose 1,7-bisphosphate 7-phosphatase n=1 Tax=Dehalobacter sp. CF TaxID=1131462 RepID=UPI00028B0317|nr:D-glycero-beta-D-manno-heptose 1,7-bisphosphate 7-phosphatase [Dehalobacter sp. CF]AFV05140.1 D-glycero-D-manno-heptose 1,7-bisphosphate phosphatase [Dehalobacter sp. CF]